MVMIRLFAGLFICEHVNRRRILYQNILIRFIDKLLCKVYDTYIKIFCDTKRLTILDYLKSGEKCACVLIENTNIGQSALSYHMKILCDSGMVNARQEGKWTHYSLSKSGSEYASKRLLELTTPNTENQSNCCI